MWHRLLLFFGIRNDFDWAPPGLGPEVNHPYIKHEALRCCKYCGGGWKHAIHQKPFNERRAAEIMKAEQDRCLEFMQSETAAARDVAETLLRGLPGTTIRAAEQCQCRKCGKVGFVMDEFTSPYTGLCVACSGGIKPCGPIENGVCEGCGLTESQVEDLPNASAFAHEARRHVGKHITLSKGVLVCDDPTCGCQPNSGRGFVEREHGQYTGI